MSLRIPVPRPDYKREKLAKKPGEVTTYQASPELRAELEAKLDKKMKLQKNESPLAPIIPGGKIKRERRDRVNTYEKKTENSDN